MQYKLVVNNKKRGEIMQEVLVLGAGSFGGKAAEALARQGYVVTVVDREEKALSEIIMPGLTKVCADGVAYMAAQDIGSFTWIVPALPLHVAFDWLLERLEAAGIKCGQVPVPEGISLPNPYYGKKGTVYASYASHLCPTDCPEPPGVCYATGEERKLPLYELLAKLDAPGYDVNVVRSYQLLPGIGGLSPSELDALSQEIAGRQRPVIIATSCACHAVLDALVF